MESITTPKSLVKISDAVVSETVLSTYLNQGWFRVSTKIVREVDVRGSFEDELVYILGHAEKNMSL